MISYLNEVVSDKGYIYSLDMIRLNLDFKDTVQGFINWLSAFELTVDEILIKHYTSYKEFAYRDLFNIEIDDYSFVMGVGFNGNSQDRYKGFIEFNPNKCKGYKFDRIYNCMRTFTYKLEVVRFDLAIDIPLPRHLVKLVKDQRNYTYICNKGSDTEYLGRRNNIGFTKLYDKTKESDLTYDITRLEITADLKGINFPEVKIMPMQNKLKWDDLSATEKVLIQLLKQVENPTMYMRQLAFRKRKKIEDYIYEETLELDQKAYNQIYMQVVSYQY
jgi:hypothetical protein